MKTFITIILLIASAALGLYVGAYLLFICGIVDIIDQVKAPVTDSFTIAISVFKIVIAAPVGWLIFYLGLAGTAVFGLRSPTRSRSTFRGL